MNELPFQIIEPTVAPVPFILSIPHCGTSFPEDIAAEYVSGMTDTPDDTDWFLEILYDFAPGLGITTILPLYSRWVIDLNREPGSKPLYDDGRITTDLCPTTDFRGVPIYRDSRKKIDEPEVERRLAKYFDPYHDKIDEIGAVLLEKHKDIVFWDGHSIRRNVPTIQKEPFPDFILGDNDQTSSNHRFINAALASLESSDFSVTHNTPFKGGYLTRSKGLPAGGIHALQLEMSKDLYMTENETVYSEEKATPVKEHLKKVFQTLISELGR